MYYAHYFYYPSPDFNTSIVSQSVTNNRCAPSCGGQNRKVRGHIKKISKFQKNLKFQTMGIVPPTCKLLPTPLPSQGASGNLNSHPAAVTRRRQDACPQYRVIAAGLRQRTATRHVGQEPREVASGTELTRFVKPPVLQVPLSYDNSFTGCRFDNELPTRYH